MFNFIKKSLRNKLLSIFIIIGFLPFLTLLVYTLFLSESKIVNKTIDEHLERTKVVIELIDNHLVSLTKEVRFLSSLDLMDDLLAEDIDKRISRLLTQKRDDLNLDITFMAVALDSTIVASSDKNILLEKYTQQELNVKNYGTYIKDNYLYMYSQISASFDNTKKLGFLVLKYNLKNLDSYLTHNDTVHSYIIDSKNNFIIGENIPIKINFYNKTNSIIDSKYVIVYEKLSSVLNDWHIVYAVDKSVALEFLYDFISFMLYMSFIIFILIIYMSIKQSREIVKPIEELTATTNYITKTQNYSAQLNVNSQDEIATLTHSFNNMLKTTYSALQTLEEENKLRLKRFTQLIEVFNTIIQTKSEDECINVSIQEIKKLTHKENLHFQKDKNRTTDKECTNLYVSDFENDEKIYFGSIELGIESFEDKNEQDFYNSIASMITLQLDKIRLIQRTTSASRAKSAFISNMSHELRTPLNAIIGFAQYMIEYEELNEDQKDTVGNIESSAQYLLGMINEILDIAKIEAGKMEAHIESANILEIVQSSYNMLSPLAKDKKIKFDFIYNNFDNKIYKTDPKMFKQIVVNLISNAIKFTLEGSVLLELYNDEENLYVSVKDSGIGISEDDMNRLFNDFTQLENVIQKSHRGTGLGLSLSKKMANILGGDVTLKSNGIGHGTLCLFSLQIK
ncbi:histidine kinase dimerization/phospho-acceptor domain-containing protein [Sulfurimonas sp.]|uniref:histidine kinase dimerization/phospho-acceptor domain-containing protein n=1 Tax=Sulfurimonas sp. TaxID=2022749 RepID=UPI00286E1AFD|nr:histidine kinase dimerization/phospho-acceptor domain-containing protein [Sulfurimonas sp.]